MPSKVVKGQVRAGAIHICCEVRNDRSQTRPYQIIKTTQKQSQNRELPQRQLAHRIERDRFRDI